MKRLAALAIAIALAAPIAASAAENPIFGTAKVRKLDVKDMKSVVGQNFTSALYAYYGNLYAGFAIQYGSYGAYLEAFGTTYRGTQSSYYYSAYAYASAASSYYYTAYAYN